MPWLETSPVDERERFIADDRLDLYTRAELCARYPISRKTGYKWLARYHEQGRRGLQDSGTARSATQGPTCLGLEQTG
jgi:transposase